MTQDKNLYDNIREDLDYIRRGCRICSVERQEYVELKISKLGSAVERLCNLLSFLTTKLEKEMEREKET